MPLKFPQGELRVTLHL